MDFYDIVFAQQLFVFVELVGVDCTWNVNAAITTAVVDGKPLVVSVLQ